MRRLLVFSILALVALAAMATTAAGATRRATITSFSPAQVPVNTKLIIKGKNFRSGAKNNRVFFSRATDGKTVRARPKKASKTRIEVVVPASITKFLEDDGSGGKKATRFQIAIFTTTLGVKTKKSRSPIILPAGSTPVTGGGGTPTATAADCDGDGTPNTSDNDDDNDLIADDTETKIGTDPCKADSDTDGIEDGFEYFSALDLNGNNLPYPGARPFPNPLDASDAATDFDRDGLSDQEEFATWMKTGKHALPLNYSAGNAFTGGAPKDGDKDADADGLSNLTELAKKETDSFNPARSPDVPGLFRLDFLSADSDGDTIGDGADDQDHDGLSNIEEITIGDDGILTDPQNPASGSPDCDGDGVGNASDGDDDNDLLADTTERNTTKTSPCNKDTDGDGLEDGFEQASAVDLNSNALPYPGKKPYPNALDGADGDKDYDGDGMTSREEFKAWIAFGGHVFPLNYSDGDQTSSGANGAGAMDLDNNGRITDEEKDADGDGLPNWLELAKGDPTPFTGCTFANTTGPQAGAYTDRFTLCGGATNPNGNSFKEIVTTLTGAPAPPSFFRNDYLDADTDGDGVNDGADDNDYDDVSNVEEVTTGGDGFLTNPIDPCDPSTDARTCPTHPSHT